MQVRRSPAFGPRCGQLLKRLSEFVATFRRVGVQAKMANRRISGQRVDRRIGITPESSMRPVCLSFIDLRPKIINSLARRLRYNLRTPMNDESNVLK
jgi:hypothetical protein